MDAKRQKLHNIIGSGILLGLFAVAGTGLLAVTDVLTQERIKEEIAKARLRTLQSLIPPERYDNDINHDVIKVSAPTALGNNNAAVYRARQQGQPVAAVLSVVAPDGYNGAIDLLVGIYTDGSVAGVRVTRHRETPGLGDAIEVERNDWILGFTGRSLGQPPRSQWTVRKDGGAFDQLTGATITSRAVVKAVKKSMIYFEREQAALFAAPPAQAAGADERTPGDEARP